MAILGLIATFTIPKVLQSVETSQKKAVFKETIGFLSEVLYKGVSEGTASGNLIGTGGLFQKNLQLAKQCGYSAVIQGCLTLNSTDKPALVFPNNAVIVGINEYSPDAVGRAQDMILDYNGDIPPNADGQDRLCMVMSYGTGDFYQSNTGFGVIPTGKIIPCPTSGASVALYNSLFTP